MSEYIKTYLNDHLSGSEVAMELLEHVESTYPGGPVARFASELRSEIASDRQALETLMARLQIVQSRTRRATAWLSAKCAELKLLVDDHQGGALSLLEVWDALSLGIEGKRLLWCALAQAAKTKSDLAGTDYTRLERRAAEQRGNVETFRLEAASAALAPARAKPR